MDAWLREEGKFEKVFLFTEDSPAIKATPPIPTQPTFGCLRRFLRSQFEDTRKPLLKPEDNLWFFFAGHGRRSADQDYLMLSDSDPGDVEHTAISVDYVTQRLRRSGADNTEDLGNGLTLDMVEIPAGSFKMGSPPGEKGRSEEEGPQHTVNVLTFFLGKFVVTQEQYQQVMGSNPSKFKGAKRPVESVSWNDAVEFCNKLSQKTGRKYRLPSEAEWEYAARAGTTTPFHFGETITTKLANYNGDYTYASAPKGEYRQKTTEVASFSPNGFGLYDMHGQVWEWCQDTWHNSYQGAPSDGSAWIDDNNQIRLLRGGSWLNSPGYCRCAYRLNLVNPVFDLNRIGFRVACTVA